MSTSKAPSRAQELSKSVTIEVSLASRDSLTWTFENKDGVIVKSDLKVRGCMELLNLAAELRPRLLGPLDAAPLPPGTGHAAVLMRELILKAQGRWAFPYKEDEVCHCRAVSTLRVDAAIVGGCHTIQDVARETSAGTSCGTCRVDTDAIIQYRLQLKA